MISNDLYGWYDSPEQPVENPTYDPPRDAPCPYCGNPCTDDDVRTHSIMAAYVPNPRRCYFWRTHRTCDEDASEGRKQSVLDGVLYRIQNDGEYL